MEGVNPQDACQQFKIDALTCQELISKTECLYERRVILNHRRDVLVKFVGSAIYADQECIQERGYNDSELKCINEVVKLIIDVNQSCDYSRENLDEIHYGVVYVFGYKELDRRVFKIPVFKIYTGSDPSPYFVSIDGGFHDGWSSFLNYLGNTRQHFIISYPAEGKYTNSVLFTDVANLASIKYDDRLRDCMIEVNLKNIIRRYASLNDCGMNESELNEKAHELVEKLTDTLGAVSPDRAIDDYMKIECFVDSMIFCKIIEELKFQWGLTMFWNLKTVNEDELTKAKNNALIELSDCIDQGEIYERFKNFWIDHKRLLFVNRNNHYEIYTFKHSERREADLATFIHEIIHDNFYFQKIEDGGVDYLRIAFHSSGDNAVIFFYEIFPNDVICFLLVPRFLVEQNQTGSMERPLLDTSEKFENDVEMENDTAETEESNNLPDDEKLREFMSKATQEQDFIAKTEGEYNHRLLLNPDEDTLQKFVSLVVFGFEGVADLEDNSKKKELKIAKNIVKRIIKENQKFDKLRRFENEIHYGAVYVIGYKKNEKSEEKKMYKIPLFKVFKKKGEEDALFIDVDLNVYQNWDEFLKANTLPKSFLCVPKNGSYKLSKKTNEVEVDFVDTPKYWNTKRAVSVGVSSAFLIGSAAFSFYTGPIGMGLTLTLPARLGIAGFGGAASLIGLGVSLHKRQISDVGNFVEKYQHSISFVLNVSSEILAVYAEGSVLAGIATGVLTGGAIGIGFYLIIRLTYDAIVKFIETRKVDMADVFNIINAALLFGNGILKLESVINFIKSCKFCQKLPTFGKLTSSDKDVTAFMSNIGSFLKVTGDVASNPIFERAFVNLFNNTRAWWKNEKDLDEYKNDLVIFGGDIIQGALEVVFPLVKSFIYKEYKVDVDKLFGERVGFGIVQEYVSKFYLHVVHKYQTGKKQRDDIIKAIDENTPNNSSGKVSQMMNEGIERAKTELSGKLVQDSDDKKSKLEKSIKAENYIQSIVLKNEIERLKTCLSDSVKPNEKKIEECINSAVDDTISEAGTSEFQEKFEEYCKNEEKLILIEEDENSKVYVFKYEGEECLNDVVRQVDENFQNDLVKVAENVYTYASENNKSVTVFLDNEDPNDVIGYVVIYF